MSPEEGRSYKYYLGGIPLQMSDSPFLQCIEKL